MNFFDSEGPAHELGSAIHCLYNLENRLPMILFSFLCPYDGWSSELSREFFSDQLL